MQASTTKVGGLSSEQRTKLLEAAKAMLERSYAPYSKFHVGAAVLTSAGKIYSGCNVENASYGLTICAERSAISAAIASEGAAMKLVAVAVLNGNSVPCSPCGGCRQVIHEFGRDAIVIFQGQNGLTDSTANTLLPAGFEL